MARKSLLRSASYRNGITLRKRGCQCRGLPTVCVLAAIHDTLKKDRKPWLTIAASDMDLHIATEKANQILDEERSYPTVQYIPRSKGNDPVTDALTGLSGTMRLLSTREQRPRPVEANPSRWVFTSTNYNLLCALLSRIREEEKPSFFAVALQRMHLAPASAVCRVPLVHAWHQLASELPLVAEFCVRNGSKENFFSAICYASPLPGHVVLLRHLEEMIALNFTVFTDSEYQHLDLCVSTYRDAAERQFQTPKPVSWRGLESISSADMFDEINSAVKGVKEECRKARFLYVKASLGEGVNLEVNQDKETVNGYLRNLGFSGTLAESLEHAERLYLEGATPFDLKSSMGHLRSFLENLHAEALRKVTVNRPLPQKWGEGLTCLRDAGLLSKAEVEYVAGLFRLISDEAVHPLVAEREYARLTRNMVIEYGLLFLRKLEKSGVRAAPNTG